MKKYLQTKLILQIILYPTCLAMYGQEINQDFSNLSNFIDDEISEQLWSNEGFSKYDPDKEIISKRTLTAKHFRNNDGSYTGYLASGPIHYIENGEMKTSYNTILDNSSGHYSQYKYANVTNRIKCFYPEDITDGSLILFDDGSELKDMLNVQIYFEENGTLISSPITIAGENSNVNEDELIYENVFEEKIDVKIGQLTNGRSFDYVLKSKDIFENVSQSATHMVFEETIILPNGWSASLVNNEVVLNNSSGINAKYEKPVCYDSPSTRIGNNNNESNSNEYKGFLEPSYNISQTGNILVIKALVDMNWLMNEKETFL